MIHFNLGISNPWAKGEFKNLWHTDGSFTKNKHWELEFTKHSYDVVNVSVALTTRSDHAGLHLKLALFSYMISFDIYDSRHWDYKNKCWEVYGTSV
jgi:hypothetical protein